MVNLSWDNIEAYVKQIASVIPAHEVDTVIGISRGGMIPSIMLSHIYQTKNVCMVIADSYNDKIRKNEPIVSHLYGYATGNILIMDDINDTGSTLEKVYNMFNDHKGSILTAVLVNKMHSKFQVDTYGIICNSWVKFPWEA